MKEAADIVSKILRELADRVGAGINLIDLADFAEGMIKDLGAEAINKGYKPEWAKKEFPAAICIGVNDIVAHGIPVDYYLKEGDIISFDIGIKKNGFCGDAGMTVGIGKISSHDERLIYYAKKTLYEGISHIRAGVSVLEIGRKIENYAALRGFVTNRYLGGHGIGAELHQDPHVPNFDVTTEKANGFPQTDYILKAGEVICIEPFLTYSDKYGVKQADGWTVKTNDGKKSAFFEHMVEVTENGCNILTTHIERG